MTPVYHAWLYNFLTVRRNLGAAVLFRSIAGRRATLGNWGNLPVALSKPPAIG